MSTQDDDKPTAARRLTRSMETLARKPYVQGLPEWAMFPDDESRRKAIERIEKGMMPRSIKGVFGFLLAVFVFLSIPWFVAHLIAWYALPLMGPWNSRIVWIMTLTGYTVLVYLGLRRDMPKALRGQLVEAGVPVCIKCGYDLRDLPAHTERCPECGRTLDSEVSRLLQ